MRISHLTPTEEIPIPVVRSLFITARKHSVAISQSIVMFGAKTRHTVITGLPVEILQYDKYGMSAEDASSHLLWEKLKNVDIVHIYRLFSNFGLYCVCVAKSLGKTVIGFDYRHNYHPIMTNAGIELIDGYHANDPIAEKMIPAIFSGPVLLQKIEPDMDVYGLIKFYMDLHANTHY